MFTSDNGGCVKLEESGGNNYPLRGGKYSDLEGGIRTAAFVSGGYLGRKGERTNEIIHIADWYATIANLAGVKDLKDYRAEIVGLPALDSRDQGQVIFGGGESAWKDEPLFLSSEAVVENEWKLIVSGKVNPAGFPGQVYPNSTSYLNAVDDVVMDCSEGCLFNVVEDRTEHHDMREKEPDIFDKLKEMLEEGSKGFYENDDVLQLECEGSVGDEVNCACYLAADRWGGYYGPYAKGE
mmetsp:Transcript_21502/g.40453  ORF Transcript_21502/g.40453 Transcript_21502/m.40453 type:complete len:238 (-) Transcript_21502:4-717(-)